MEQQQAVRGTSAWHSITGHAVMQNTAYSKRFTGLQSAWPLVSEDTRHGANSKQYSGGKGWQQLCESQHTSTVCGAGEHDMQHCRQLAG